MAQLPSRMELIMVARYAPLALPQLLNALPKGDYLKYLPKYIGEGDGTSTEEHLVLFIVMLILKILSMRMYGQGCSSKA